MPRSILFIICLISLVACVSGYGFVLNCPENVQIGIPLKCSIDSDFPQGKTFDIVFIQTKDTAAEISRQPLTIQGNQITQYAFLDTKGYPGGNYKVEAQYTGSNETQLRTGSVTMQMVNLVESNSRTNTTAIITSGQTPATTFTQTVTVSKTTLQTVTITASATPTITVTPSLIQTMTVSATPTKSVQDLLNEQNKKIDEQNKLIAEQNKKIESQNDLLTQFMSKFKSIFGWN